MSAASNNPRPKVTVAVTGGIAAYKAVELVRELQQANLDPHVVMTASAEQFVTPLTFAAISGHDVISTLWSGAEVPKGEAQSSVEHIEQAQTTRALIIAPATANVLAKLAHGLADDFLTTMYLALPAATPVLIAPSMNVGMWHHPAVQANVATLRARGVNVLETEEGYLACGMVGSGRMPDVPVIVAAVLAALNPAVTASLAGQTVLVTAGGTREPVDGVRFLGNRSSGKMGYALAAEAQRRGATVLLVSAATSLPAPAGVTVYPVTTTAEMHTQVLALLPKAALVLKAGAPADFRPRHAIAGKLHRDTALTLELEPTEDIVADVVRQRRPGTRVIAFAAEMSHDIARAREKMLRKGVDAIILNDVSSSTTGFDSDANAGTMLLREGDSERIVEIPPMSKDQMAARILDEISALR